MAGCLGYRVDHCLCAALLKPVLPPSLTDWSWEDSTLLVPSPSALPTSKPKIWFGTHGRWWRVHPNLNYRQTWQSPLLGHVLHVFCLFCFAFTEVQFIYNVVLVAGVQQSDSVLYIYIFNIYTFHSLFHYRLIQDTNDTNELIYKTETDSQT